MKNSDLAFCGLDCHQCPTYLATQADDDEARKKTAAFYNKAFGFDVSHQDINCDGCKASGGRLFEYCSKCSIKKCAQARSFSNCSECDEAPCADLSKFHEFSPVAKSAFEALRKDQ